MIKKTNLYFPNEIYKLSRLLSVTINAIRKARQQELYQYSVHSRRAALLLAIHILKDKATPVALGQMLLRERNSISELLSRCEKDGLVKKKWDLERKNGVRAVLTPKGLKLTQKVNERKSIEKIMSSLSADESERLRTYLTKLQKYILEKIKLKASVPNLPVDDPFYELYGLLLSTTELVLKARNNELKDLNIENARAGVLITIVTLGDRATPVAIGRELFRTSHSILELLSRAEKDGLVEKKRYRARKNGVRVVLTPKGKKLYRRCLESTVLPRIMFTLPKKERADLKSLLQILYAEALKASEIPS